MTAAGIAFIAGGLATLISLRSVLFGGGKRRRAAGKRSDSDSPQRRAPRRRAAEQTSAAAVDLSETAPLGLRALDLRAPDHGAPPADDQLGGLASIGLAAEDDYEPADPAAVPEAAVPEQVEPVDEAPAELSAGEQAEPVAEEFVPDRDDEESRPIPVRRVDRSDRRYGDRVDGWVRPEYHNGPADSPSGEYWTPVPMDDLDFDLAEDDPEPSAKGYGWPIPVERLPAVPDYEPATGFDLTPVPAEPTELVPVWPPVPGDRRIRLPRSWSSRNEKPADNRFTENESPPRRRRSSDEVDQRFRPPGGEPERRRPRPRPRPAPDPDNVYVSRHAAEPPR
jgi:hypothetical protein